MNNIQRRCVVRPCSIPDLKLCIFTDAECAANKLTSKSTGGHVVFFGHTPVLALCKMQSVVAPSTQASELIQLFVAGKQVVWIKQVSAELKLMPSDYAVPLVTDSSTTLKAVKVITY